jgi:hypothetical protein
MDLELNNKTSSVAAHSERDGDLSLFMNLCSHNINKLASDGDLLHPPCGTSLAFLRAQGD